ncbi:restriction endonuclease [Kitasatospora sp. NPDC097691]|uniref:restriction endonuclease n=1 Tax=Kitasatospora sp. NPDC097691 TaxID=3157231 RepID=UPI003324B91E
MGRKRRSATARRRAARLKVFGIGGLVAAVLLVVFWHLVWVYVVVAAAVAGVVAGSWMLWRRDRTARREDRRWRERDAVAAGHRTLAEVDRMTGTEFEDFVAALCRRDGCTRVERVGGAGDNGADIKGVLPDGRTMIVQCKRYAPGNAIPAREIRDLMGALRHHRAEVAVFVTTSRFTRPAQDLCTEHGIWALHRDLLGLWNNGAGLLSFPGINGAGQGDRQHLARWKRTYQK